MRASPRRSCGSAVSRNRALDLLIAASALDLGATLVTHDQALLDGAIQWLALVPGDLRTAYRAAPCDVVTGHTRIVFAATRDRARLRC
jgi:hypothetical protein